MAAPDAGPIRMMGTLGFAGFASGLALVGIFLVTAPVIERNRAEALEGAIFRVLPGAETRQAFVLKGDALEPYVSEGGHLPEGEAVYVGYDADGKPLGFAIPAEGPGFQDTIKLLYGYDPVRKRVIGMEVLESRETPGLGDKIVKDRAFIDSFRDLAIEPAIVASRRGASLDNEIDAISGATISSNAVVRIINEANAHWLDHLPVPIPPRAGDATALAGATGGRD